jgi:hypothetical protein
VEEEFAIKYGEALINQRRWLLSHTVRCSRAENRIETVSGNSGRANFRALMPDRFSLNLSERFASSGAKRQEERTKRVRGARGRL